MFETYGIGSWWTSMLSVGPEHGIHPQSVIFSSEHPTADNCRPKNKIFGLNSINFYLDFRGRFDYSRLLIGPIRIHEWDTKTDSLRTYEVAR